MTTIDMPIQKPVSALRSRFTLKTEAERFALVAAWLFLIILFGILMPDSFLAGGTSPPCSARRPCLWC